MDHHRVLLLQSYNGFEEPCQKSIYSHSNALQQVSRLWKDYMLTPGFHEGRMYCIVQINQPHSFTLLPKIHLLDCL